MYGSGMTTLGIQVGIILIYDTLLNSIVQRTGLNKPTKFYLQERISIQHAGSASSRQLAFRLSRSRWSCPQSTSTSLLTPLYGATRLHNDSVGASDDNESVMTLVNIRSHAQMIYSIYMIPYMPSFPCSLSCLSLQPLEDSVETLSFNGHT